MIAEQKYLDLPAVLSVTETLRTALQELVERRAYFSPPGREDGSDGRYVRARAALKKADEVLGEKK